MSFRYDSRRYNYETVAEKKIKIQKSLEKMKKKDPDIRPVVVSGRNIAKTWWGKAWIGNFQLYADYSNRIGRGSSYVKHGAVLDLKIAPGKINTIVQGSRKTPYNVEIDIKPLKPEVWESITKQCQGKIESLQELLEGKFPESLADLFTALGKGLFPAPNEIFFSCSCPDWADMCKHVAASLYAVGARFDEDPSLFFLLRNVDIDELISNAVEKRTETLIEKSDKKSDRKIEDDDVSSMFGIDMD